jgi:hypothetical protein
MIYMEMTTTREPIGMIKVVVTFDEKEQFSAIRKIPEAVQQWYKSLKSPKMSDELFYLSEIAEALEQEAIR